MAVPQFLTVTASQRCGCPTRILDLYMRRASVLMNFTLRDTGLLACYIHVFVEMVLIVVQRSVLPTATKS